MLLFQDFKGGKNLLTQRHQFRATFCTCRSLSNSWLHGYGCEWMWRPPERWAQIICFLWGLIKPRRPWGKKTGLKERWPGSGLTNPLCCPLLLCWCSLRNKQSSSLAQPREFKPAQTPGQSFMTWTRKILPEMSLALFGVHAVLQCGS